MPGEELLRNLWPEVLDLTEASLPALAGRDPTTRGFLASLVEDLRWARSRPALRGWVARSNPFLRLDFAAQGPLQLRSVRFRQSPWIVRGNAWFGIGMWVLAERYYKRAARNAIAGQHVGVVFEAAIRLGVVYLGAGCGASGVRLGRHLQYAAAYLSGSYRARTERSVNTVLCLALIMNGQYQEAEQTGRRLRAPAGGPRVDESLYRPLADTFWATGQSAELGRWRESWWDLRRITDSQ